MSFPEHSNYSRGYIAAIQWANIKFPQTKFVLAVAGGAAIMQEVARDGSAWDQFTGARASEVQLRKLGLAAQFAHRQRGIEMEYQPEAMTIHAVPERGRVLPCFGNDLLNGLVNGARGSIRESVSRYAQPLGSRMNRPVDPVQELFSGKYPEEVNGLAVLWQAGAAALHSEAGLAIGQQLDEGLSGLDPEAEEYRACRSEMRSAACRELGNLLIPTFSAARQPIVNYAQLMGFTSGLLR